MTRIKICGLFRPVDIEYVNEIQPDYIGFVFAGSRRQVTMEQAERLRKNLSDAILPVGVFVNAPIEDVISLLQNGVITIAQLHGNEDEAYIEKLKSRTQQLVIKALRADGAEGIRKAQNSAADFLLLDHGTGGTGKVFDWELARACKKSFFLAGGIHAGNVEEAIKRSKPFAIDLSSGAETDGKKDRRKILEIVRRVRNV